MSKFKIGDKVKLRKDSWFYKCSSNSNPANIEGIVKGYSECILPVEIQWDNHTRNSYNESDLELILETKGEV